MKVYVKFGDAASTQKNYEKINILVQEYDLAEILAENKLLMSELYTNEKLFDEALDYIQKKFLLLL